MTDPLDPDSVLKAAEDAAGAGDYEAAERLLREAAAMQEEALGPLHPDLAITLNNLAFVCERTNKLDEAERGYRRAHAIAVASLSPGHPFVATSLKNLLDFCASRGIPVWAPPATESTAEASSPAVAAKQEPELAFKSEIQEGPVQPVQPIPLVPARTEVKPRRAAIAALAAGALVAVLFIMLWRGSDDSPEASTQVQPAPSESRPAAPLPAPAPQPESRPTEPAREASAPPTPEPQTPEPVEQPQVAAAATPDAPVTVLNAQLCSALVRQGSPEWECTPVNGPGEPGTFTFYTRLQTDSDTTVEHRWYYRDALHQRMRLRVRANPDNGFRTYSSNTVSPERAGDWKVELRAADGSLLQEERFVVR